MACGNIWFKPRQCWLNDASHRNFYHAKPQRHKEEEHFLSSSLCAFAALRDNFCTLDCFFKGGFT
jgi:hypothetical protein